MNHWSLYQKLILPASFVVSDMEMAGVHCDAEVCIQQAFECQTEAQAIEQDLNDWAGRELNWASPKQVSGFLYEERRFPIPPVSGTLKAVKITKKGERPTSEASIQHLADHAKEHWDRDHLRKYLRWKKLTKLEQFFAKLPEYRDSAGRIHPMLRIATETGRLTSKNPNLQNQPNSDEEADLSGTRMVFTAPEGMLLGSFDYDGLEWRILAHIVFAITGNRALIDDIEAGIDPHSATASRVYAALGRPIDCDVRDIKKQHPLKRAHGKILNYAIPYGKGARGLSVQLRDANDNPIGEAKAQEMLDAFFDAAPGVYDTLEALRRYAYQHGYCRTLLQRIRFIPELKSGAKWIRQRGERLAVNTPIQGGAADIVMRAMIDCSPRFNPYLAQLLCQLILQIHDELLFECPEKHCEEAGEVIKRDMETCLMGWHKFHAPLSVSGQWAKTWELAKA